jgi:hypothetical protein
MSTDRTGRWLEYVNTSMLAAVVLVAIATLVGVYTQPARPTVAADRAVEPSGLTTSLGRTLVIPMGFYYGTYVMYTWIRTFDRPFRMRVDTGSSSLLFGDLHGCFDGAHALCLQEAPGRSVPMEETFGDTAGQTVRPATLLPNQMTFGYIAGVPRIEPVPLQVRVGDNSTTFVFGIGFGNGPQGLMNQLKVRRIQVWLVNETWSLRMPCQVVLSPTGRPDPKRILLEVPLVTQAEFAQAVGPIKSPYPTYVFRVAPPPAPVATTVQFAVIDIGSTLSYVPLRAGTTRVTDDVVLGVTGSAKAITLSKSATVPIDTTPIDPTLAKAIVLIGNRALNELVLDVDLDDGPTGTLRLMRPI